MKLYLVRHGETDANAGGIVQGWLDTSLNEKGFAQAAQVANEFNEGIDVVYSSDLMRAAQTAAEFRKKYANVPYLEDARLRERNFGDATANHRDEYDWEQFWSLDDRVTIPNAEVLTDFTARIMAFLDELKRQQYESVLIVTHGGVLNRIQYILDPSHKYQPHKNASILEVDI